MIISFLTHEIAHKVTAQKKGLWAEFRLTTFGSTLNVCINILAFPHDCSRRHDDWRHLTEKRRHRNHIHSWTHNQHGILSGISRISLYAAPFIRMVRNAAVSAYINAFMAVFNLVPFGVLDGLKIFNLNKKVWVAAFVPAAILALFTYLLFV